MGNQFEEAAKKRKQQGATIDVSTAAEEQTISPHARPSRKDTKHIGGYYPPEVSKQLRLIALEEDNSVQDLLAEAIDMIFQSRQKPTIAVQKTAN